MPCPSCGRANRAGARFCGGCGAALSVRCVSCGAANEPGARFCDACGEPLGAAPTPAVPAPSETVARKVVTIVFADLIGSTALQERLDPESVARVMEAYHASVRTPIEAHGGTVVQLLGDGVMCAFGVPQVAEDDALRAVRAAASVQRSFRAFLAEHPELAGKVGLRVAVNTGEVVVSDDYAAGIGDPLNVAARLQQEARDGDVLIGEATQRHVREHVTLAHVGTFALKGRAEPVAAYRVESLERPARAAAVPFVGREGELRRVLAVYESAVATPAARLAVVLGSPGLGKSRLAEEIARRLAGQATLLAVRCEGAGAATFAPLAEVLRPFDADALLPAGEPERARIAAGIAALVAGEPAVPQEVFFVVRRFLAALAKTQPVVLAIDDLHWAEPLLLDLVEHLVQWGAGVPLLVLGAARPELREARSSLATPGAVASEVVTLTGLDAAAATQLAAQVVGADQLPAAIAGRVLAASEGNPLFLGELIRMLADDGVLRREGERWVAAADLAALDMPPTIHALLAARIERLRPEERLVLERAAIVGRHFSRSAVAELLPREAGDLDVRLEALRRTDLIERDSGWFLGEPALRFHHALIRDAAYRRVLKGTRAELHVRLADWIGARSPGPEQDETVGWHLEQAHQSLLEIGPLDERGRGFGERAARHLGAAGQRALARLEPGHPARADLALDACEALLATGEIESASAAIADLGRLGADSERLRAWHTCFAAQLAVMSDPGSLRGSAEAVAAAARTLAAVGDAAGEAKAHSVHAAALARLGAIGACETALDLALAAARHARDRRRVNAVLAGSPLAALWGPSPVTRASGRCLDVVRVLRITHGAPGVEAVALRCQAVLEALRGRVGAARRMLETSRRMVEELGISQQVLEADVFLGHVALLDGDAAEAERWLRPAWMGLRERGLRIDAARAAALLARARLARGEAGEAEALSRESESLAGDDLQASIAWRGVRAEALAQRGMHAEALALARAAVEIAASTDALLHHADARLALAVALRAAGRDAEAAAEEARTLELWEAKGATLLVERMRGEGAPAAPRLAAAAGTGPRRIRDNAATAHLARLDAAIAARDLNAVEARLAATVRDVHHPTGTTWDRQGALASLRNLLRAEGLQNAHEPLATLGEHLALARLHVAFDASAPELGPFGATEREYFQVVEVDAAGRGTGSEFFASDRLGDAVVCLYQRYAEGLPEGATRRRAEAVAHSVAGMLHTTDDQGAFRAALAPGIQYQDHQRLGFGRARGAEAIRRGNLALEEQLDGLATRIDEVLALEPGWLVVLRTTTGSDRIGGGRVEFHAIHLYGFDADGAAARLEHFAPDAAEQALGRLAELMAPRRRVAPNAASANVTRLDAVVRTRDADALPDLFAEGHVTLHHPTGISYDRAGVLASIALTLRAERGRISHEPIATLGDRLALAHLSVGAAATAPEDGSFGPTERDHFLVVEVDAAGRRSHTEFFADDRLADVLVRLYERYAESLPAGPARERSAGAARALAVVLGANPEQLPNVVAEGVEFADRRRLALYGGARGRGAMVHASRVLLRITEGLSLRTSDVLAATAEGVVVRNSITGTDRVSGGAFAREELALHRFGPDGRVTQIEFFDGDAVGAALARFDQLTSASPPRRVRPNLATANAARMDAAVAARDLEAVYATFADDARSVHHPTGTETSEREARRAYEVLLAAEGLEFGHEPIATLGERLALLRGTVRFDAVSTYDRGPVGAADMSTLVVAGVDSAGLRSATEFFAVDRLDDALARLYERWAEQEGDGTAAAIARAVAVVSRMEVDELPQVLAPDVAFADHRPLGLGRSRGVEPYLRGLRSLIDVSHERRTSTEEVLTATPAVLVTRRLTRGVDRTSGGAFELELLMLWAFGEDARVTHIEMFPAEHAEAALARADQLAGAAPRATVPPNAALRSFARFGQSWRERRSDRMLAEQAPGHVLDDRRPMTGIRLDGDALAENNRLLLAAPESRWSHDAVATRGERLALVRARVTGLTQAGAEFVAEHLSLLEVNGDGRQTASVLFALEALAPACAELDRRYALGEGAGHGAVLGAQDRFRDAFARRDFDALAALYASDVVVADHRPLGWEPLTGTGYLDSLRVLVSLAPDVALHVDHVETNERGLLWVGRWAGTREGGPFETPWITVTEHDASGRVLRLDTYDPAQLDEARSRLAAVATPVHANAARQAADRMVEVLASLDWERLEACFAPGFRNIDRQRTAQLESSREEYLASLRAMLAEFVPPLRVTTTALATRGEHLLLGRIRFSGIGANVGPSEFELLELIEVDSEGRLVLEVSFDPEALAEAHADLERRAAALAPGGPPNAAVRAGERVRQLALAGDWDGLRRLCEPIVWEDRRRLFRTTLGCEELVANTRALGREVWERTTRTLLASEGDRLALHQNHFRWGPAGGELAADNLEVSEVDGAGRIVASVLFDVDERRAASRELMERFFRGEGAETTPRRVADFALALDAHDLAGVREALPEDFVFTDRRPLGLGRIAGREAYLASLVALWQESPDAHTETLHTVELAPQGQVRVMRAVGTGLGGGAFESGYVVAMHYRDGLVAEVELYALADLALARERLAAWGARDPLAIPPNATARMMERYLEAFVSGDLTALAALCAPGFVFDDRQRHALVRGGVEMILPTAEASAGRAVATRRLLATAGERLSLHHTLWTAKPGTPAFELESLTLAELDAEGRLARLVLFDSDAPAAASRELHARYHAGEGARPGSAAFLAFLDAMNAHDAAAARAALPDDFRIEDHRRTGVGRLVSADEYVESLRALWEQSPDAHAVTLHYLAAHENATLSVGGIRGTLASGGAFESLFLRIAEYRGGRWVGVEVFEVDDEARARARFEALRPGAPAVAPNAATRASERRTAAFEARDWGAFEALCSPDLVWEDRRRGVLLTGDFELFMRSNRILAASSTRSQRTLLETAGDRLALERSLHAGVQDGVRFEIETLRVTEVDTAGRLVALVLFDPDDHAGATAELRARSERESAEIPPNSAAWAADQIRGLIRSRDIGALRALAAPGFRFDDRRRRALVSGDLEMYLRNLAVVSTYPELRTRREVLATVGDRVVLSQLRYEGDPTGAAFEGEFLILIEVDAEGRLLAALHFDAGDRADAFDEAHARFAAGEAADQPAQRAVAAMTRASFGRRGWDSLRACFTEDATTADHRRLGLGSFRADEWIESLRAFVELSPDVRFEAYRTLAWGPHGRVSLARAYGTRDGGAFENRFIAVALTRGDQIRRYEFYDIGDEARALARFAEESS